ncbi:MAG: riboflavin biosynthesis protein RibD [Nitrospiraceae bacterium]|nr:riboflavin biosynthesis protein RibD [Nitrospiraceae bacterium]
MTDVTHMSLALRLATKGLGRTGANPMVGAVVVKNGQVIGQGYHHAIGEPHAEVHALAHAGEKARGSSLYVTLEPCVHENKRTSPCVPTIISSGVARVIVAMTDPNPAVNGKGIHALRQAGLNVTDGVCRAQASRLNRPFIKLATTGRPYVTLKISSTLDGKIAAANGESRWITSIPARRYVHRLRSRVDAVLVGIGTILMDDPSLTVRLPGENRHQPHRVIIDSQLRIPLEANAIGAYQGVRILIACATSNPTKKGVLEKKGVEIIEVSNGHGRVSFPLLMAHLGQMGFAHIMIEGGSHINASALEARIVDHVLLMTAPMFLGGHGARSLLEGSTQSTLADRIMLTDLHVRHIGPDLIIEGRPDSDTPPPSTVNHV